MTTAKLFALILGCLAIANPTLANIHHLVIFRYEANVPEATRADIAKRFLALKSVAKHDGHNYIVSIAGGRSISREGFSLGFEEAFIVVFRNQADRDYFVGKPYSEVMDPDHFALAKVVEPLIARDASGKPNGLFVFDFDDGAVP